MGGELQRCQRSKRHSSRLRGTCSLTISHAARHAEQSISQQVVQFRDNTSFLQQLSLQAALWPETQDLETSHRLSSLPLMRLIR